MPRNTINFDTVRKIGLTLPGVEESTMWGLPALKIHGKLGLRPLSSLGRTSLARCSHGF
jgi:hypothetical protein